MGNYYRIDNWDKKETIDPYEVANTKYEAFTCYSLQIAILTVFLGFGHRGSRVKLGEWVGRWNLNRIHIHNNGEDDNESDDFKDVSTAFLKFLGDTNQLSNWLAPIDLIGLLPSIREMLAKKGTNAPNQST